MSNFVTTSGQRFMLNGKEFKFLGTNYFEASWYGHNVHFSKSPGVYFSDTDMEQHFINLASLGIRVCRIHTLTSCTNVTGNYMRQDATLGLVDLPNAYVNTTTEAKFQPLQKGEDNWNESPGSPHTNPWLVYDRIISYAKNVGIKLILSLGTADWPGGFQEMAGYKGRFDHVSIKYEGAAYESRTSENNSDTAYYTLHNSGDEIVVCDNAIFNRVWLGMAGLASSSIALSYKYWNGAWTSLSPSRDWFYGLSALGTQHQRSNYIEFTPPVDWAVYSGGTGETANWNGKYCVKIVSSTTVTTAPLIQRTLKYAAIDVFDTTHTLNTGENNEVLNSFKAFISHVLNRTNTLTNVAYKNEPAIMAWETWNEADLGVIEEINYSELAEFHNKIGAYVKTIDSNHLFSTGSTGIYYSATQPQKYWRVDFYEELNRANIDFQQGHLYPNATLENGVSERTNYINLTLSNWKQALDDRHSGTYSAEALNKPWIIGEWNYSRDNWPDPLAWIRDYGFKYCSGVGYGDPIEKLDDGDGDALKGFLYWEIHPEGFDQGGVDMSREIPWNESTYQPIIVDACKDFSDIANKISDTLNGTLYELFFVIPSGLSIGHFEVQFDKVDTFDSEELEVMSSLSNPECFKYETEGGYVAFPSVGLKNNWMGHNVKIIYGLSTGTWYWRTRAA